MTGESPNPEPYISYGNIAHDEIRKQFVIDAAPHVRQAMRRFFVSTQCQGHTITLSDTVDNATSIKWFMLRYPLRSMNGALAKVEELAAIGKARDEKCMKVLNMTEIPPSKTIIPLRDYQTVGVHLLAAMKRLLVGDDVGLGKTAIACGAIANGAVPAIIVCQTHLPTQWKEEIEKFVFGAQVAIAKKGSPHKLPPHNVLILSYSKLSGWQDALEDYRLVVFDECQELRRDGTAKYNAACSISKQATYVLSLSATPIYNYGDEIFNVIDATNPGVLGSLDSFRKDWCETMGDHHPVKDPVALGSYLASQFLMLRRRRADVGRELPPVHRITHLIDHDAKKLADIKDRSLALALAVMNGTYEERGQAARQLSTLMRQQTGIAKAPFVAEFVEDMVKSGEKVVLTGWHRNVYDVWLAAFKEVGIKAVLYTGSESPTQKTAAVREFTHGDAQVFIMSLRSGAGLNELQKASRVIVHGELDWSPQVHYQCEGRLNRDEQIGQVSVIYLVTEDGSDPDIAMTLGLKKLQSEGIIDHDLAEKETDAMLAQVEIPRASLLAKSVLEKYHPSKK